MTRTPAGSDLSWIKKTTMIYIDQPVGTGFSYSTTGTETYLTTMEEAGAEFATLVENIWTKFPDFAAKDLYMTGESYAGKYIPYMSWLLHETESNKYNLKASLIGDPYTAPITQRTHMHIVPEALNILDDSNMPQIAALRKRCQELELNEDGTTLKDPAQASKNCSDIMDYIVAVSGDVFPYDNRIFSVDWDKVEDPVINYFTLGDG